MTKHEANVKPLLSNRSYDLMWKIVSLGLPGLGTAYFAIAKIWNLEYGVEVVGTLAALAALFGVVLKISQVSYSKVEAMKDVADNSR